MGSEKKLSSSAIERIIKTCGEVGVSELKFGDLHVRFDKPVNRAQEDRDFRSEVSETPFSQPDTEISAIQEQAYKESLERDEVALREEQLSQMFIEDPAQAERLLLDGKLSEEADEHDGEALER